MYVVQTQGEFAKEVYGLGRIAFILWSIELFRLFKVSTFFFSFLSFSLSLHPFPSLSPLKTSISKEISIKFALLLRTPPQPTVYYNFKMPPVLISPRKKYQKTYTGLLPESPGFPRQVSSSVCSPLRLNVWLLPAPLFPFLNFSSQGCLHQCLHLGASLPLVDYFPVLGLHTRTFMALRWPTHLPFLAFTLPTLSLVCTLFYLVLAPTTGIYLHGKLTCRDKSVPSGVR